MAPTHRLTPHDEFPLDRAGQAARRRADINRVVADLARIAVADIRDLFDDRGVLLPPDEVPAALRVALKVYSVPDDVLRKHVRDRVALDRDAYRGERADPAFVTYGPRTRREFLNLKTWGG